MRDALSGADGTQPLSAMQMFGDALSGAVRRATTSDVQETVEQQHEDAVQRLVERGAVPQQRRRASRHDESSAQAARLTASVPDAHGPTRRSSTVPQQNLVAQGRRELEVPSLRPYR
ncbi:hypothetical protein GIY23_01540 [Allosaccharopolyspora coralli]|uniref:Uncharacterized protein n=1 Tax=Allosaccharopolyspora coralli TaxID=2665642 RepID=A0A5Q3Q5I1_9PSEU|nr:hypothetical protein [Allosaccharopolyspora coralli]QGK68414.1 hypothetical protein GIY23_01540 [Allosaccharopolyspora coralli]